MKSKDTASFLSENIPEKDKRIPGIGFIFQGSWGHSDPVLEKHNEQIFIHGIKPKVNEKESKRT